MTKKDVNMDEVAFADCFIRHYLERDEQFLACDKKTQDMVLSFCGACVIMLLHHLDIKVLKKKRVKTSKSNVAKA